ncbi:MAG: class I SAM-dependent RNA methyltransferase [Calditrichaeota bacterium]|nr:class I SAM-dependent RNA methyltransferase [Calditrichota bacterium]
MAPLVSFDSPDGATLIKNADAVAWDTFFTVHETFAIFSQTVDSQIDHSLYAAQALKDAIVDQFRKKYYSRPSVDRQNPDVWFNIYIENDRATVSLDLGGALHKRGYRRKQLEAPMKETLAAAIVRLSEWHGSMPLWDPFCGSGTLLCEALMHFHRIPAGYLRKNLSLKRLPDFEAEPFQVLQEGLKEGVRKATDRVRILGSDADFRAIAAAKTNLRCLPYGDRVKLKVGDFRDADGFENGVIITNPPFGTRLGSIKELTGLYREFGDFLKNKCKGSTAYIYVGNRELIPALGLKTSRKIPLFNGALDGRLVKLELY